MARNIFYLKMTSAVDVIIRSVTSVKLKKAGKLLLIFLTFSETATLLLATSPPWRTTSQKLLKAKAALVVADLFTTLTKCSVKAVLGIKAASSAQNATVFLTQGSPVTDRIMTSTALVILRPKLFLAFHGLHFQTAPNAVIAVQKHMHQELLWKRLI